MDNKHCLVAEGVGQTASIKKVMNPNHSITDADRERVKPRTDSARSGVLQHVRGYKTVQSQILNIPTP